MEPESNFNSLPHEITLEVIHGQELNTTPTGLHMVNDEIDILQPKSDASFHPAPNFSAVNDEIANLPKPLKKGRNKQKTISH